MASPGKLRKVARVVAQRQGLNPSLFEKQIAAESDFQNLGPNQANAAGVAQLTPGIVPKGVDRMNPRQALKTAAKIMADYVHKYGDYRSALVAYNAGPGRVGKPLYPETRAYIQKITGGGAGQKGLGQPRSGAGGSAAGDSSATASLVDPGKAADVKLQQVPQFDQAAFDKAKNASLVGQLLAGHHGTGGVLFKTGVLSTQAPNPADYTKTTLQSTAIPGTAPTVKQAPSAPDTAAAGGNAGSLLARADLVDRIHPSYKWGGGHSGNPRQFTKQTIRGGLDCSGAVSYALGLTRPMTSGELAGWGHAGPGKVVTVYANSSHVFLGIKDPRTGKERFWGTSGFARPNGGAGWFTQTPGKAYLAKFTKRHPPGQ